MSALQPAPRLVMTELTQQELRRFERGHPELSGSAAAVILTSDHASQLAQLILVYQRLAADAEQMSRMIEAMLPPVEVPGAAATLQARRNAQARASLLEEFGALSSAQVAENAGSRASNRAALANRWRTQRRIFAVSHQGRTCFPAFQFDDQGQPLPAVAAVLGLLGHRDGWAVALWFVAANGWLGGARPVDRLVGDPDSVIEAARQEGEELVF